MKWEPAFSDVWLLKSDDGITSYGVLQHHSGTWLATPSNESRRRFKGRPDAEEYLKTHYVMRRLEGK